MLFELHPWHALWGLAGCFLLVAASSSSPMGWFLIALLCAGGGWYARGRTAVWPPGVRDVLVSRRLATPAPPPPFVSQPQRASGFTPYPRVPPPPTAPAVVPPIPFRAMTIPELLIGAVRITARNWLTLVGIPFGIGLALLLLCSYALNTVLYFMAETSLALTGNTLLNPASLDRFISGIMTLGIVFIVVAAAVLITVAFPADALMLGLSVLVTDKAVHRQPVHLAEVWVQARRRMFAVCRMNLALYAIGALLDVVVIGSLFLVAHNSGFQFSIFWYGLPVFVVSAASIVLSLSPIVVVVEGRGVGDSLRRSVSLCRPAWGRIIGIHLLGSVSIILALIVTLGLAIPSVFVVGWLANLLVFAVAAGCWVCFRVLQMLIYTDLRMRQEGPPGPVPPWQNMPPGGGLPPAQPLHPRPWSQRESRLGIWLLAAAAMVVVAVTVVAVVSSTKGDDHAASPSQKPDITRLDEDMLIPRSALPAPPGGEFKHMVIPFLGGDAPHCDPTGRWYTEGAQMAVAQFDDHGSSLKIGVLLIVASSTPDVNAWARECLPSTTFGHQLHNVPGLPSWAIAAAQEDYRSAEVLGVYRGVLVETYMGGGGSVVEAESAAVSMFTKQIARLAAR